MRAALGEAVGQLLCGRWEDIYIERESKEKKIATSRRVLPIIKKKQKLKVQSLRHT
jgi:hypothetical protein